MTREIGTLVRDTSEHHQTTDNQSMKRFLGVRERNLNREACEICYEI